jgi:hypothetical protein
MAITDELDKLQKEIDAALKSMKSSWDDLFAVQNRTQRLIEPIIIKEKQISRTKMMKLRSKEK